MNLTLWKIYGEDKTLLAKYPEPWKDSSHNDQFNFYAWDYWPEVIHPEEARFLPVIWKELTVLMWEWVLDPSMLEYYQKTYPESFSDENIIPYYGTAYYQHISTQVKNKTLVTLHPYSQIIPEKYFLDSNLVFNLNDKTQLSKLTSSIAHNEILPLEEIAELTNFPFVLKAKSGASGDWVRIIYNQKCLTEALSWFKLEKKLLVEEFIEHTQNVGIQIFVTGNWEVKVLWTSSQDTSKKGEYEWSIINTKEKVDPKACSIAIEAGQNAAKMWFIWVAGLDMLKSKKWKYYLIDPNFRLTGATTLFLLSNKIEAETGNDFLKVQQFKSNHPDIKTMIEENWKLWTKELYLLSAFKHKINGSVNQTIHWFAIHSWKDPEELAVNKGYYKSKWFNL